VEHRRKSAAPQSRGGIEEDAATNVPTNSLPELPEGSNPFAPTTLILGRPMLKSYRKAPCNCTASERITVSWQSEFFISNHLGTRCEFRYTDNKES
jgi:hypothetical protein